MAMIVVACSHSHTVKEVINSLFPFIIIMIAVIILVHQGGYVFRSLCDFLFCFSTLYFLFVLKGKLLSDLKRFLKAVIKE